MIRSKLFCQSAVTARFVHRHKYAIRSLSKSYILRNNVDEKESKKNNEDLNILQLNTLIPGLEGQHKRSDLSSDEVVSNSNSRDILESESKPEGESVQSKTTENDEQFQILNRFLDESYHANNENISKAQNSGNKLESTSFSLDKLGEMGHKRHSNTSVDDFKPVDIDKTDETIFDMDFLQSTKNEDQRIVYEQEKLLFKDIFNKYLSPSTEDKKGHFDLLNLKDLMDIKPRHKTGTLDNTIESTQLRKISSSLKDELFLKTREALQPTIEEIENMNNVSELISYHNQIISRWKDQVNMSQRDTVAFENTYLSELLKSSTNFSDTHQAFISTIIEQSQKMPQSPLLNVFTVPIIFNYILHRLCFDFHDGQLAFSLFNIIKDDINLYTVICNQQTYNEILRIIWLYFGKSNLYAIEMIYVEMLNNGFTGDIITFNILKNIIVDYHSLKMGKHHINKPSHLPIWCKEDDKRVDNLERKLQNLGNALRLHPSL